MEQYIPQAEPARTPPSSPKAERSVLGAMLRSREAAMKGEEGLRPGDFYDPANREIFDATKGTFVPRFECSVAS